MTVKEKIWSGLAMLIIFLLVMLVRHIALEQVCNDRSFFNNPTSGQVSNSVNMTSVHTDQ